MKLGRWLLWLALMAVALLQVNRSVVVTDVSSFLPGPANIDQRLVVDQLRDGLSTRILLIGLSLDGLPANTRPGAQQSEALTAASRALREKLAADPNFAWVSNGDLDALATERERLFAARYLLSPGINQQLFSQAGLNAAFAQLQQKLRAVDAAAIRPLAPADPTLAALQLLESAGRQLGPASGGGVWLSADGRVALLLMETSARGSDIGAMGATIRAARASATEVLRQWPAGEPAPRIEFAGSGYFNVLSHEAIGRDAQELALLAIVLVAGLLLWTLKSPRFIALAVVPVASGALAGYAVVSWTHGSIHGITLAFGVTLIGEAVDYAIYTFVQSDERGAYSTLFWRRVYLAALTSLIGFAAMYFSGFAGLEQLGLFSMVGLLVAATCTRWLLPTLLPQKARAASLDRFAWLPALCLRMRAGRWGLLLVSITFLGLLLQRQDGMWQDSLDSLSSSSPSDDARDLRYRADAGVPDMRSMVAVRGTNLEEALQRTEATSRLLDTLVAAKSLGGYDSPARLLPSHALQTSRQAVLPEADLLRTQVREAANAVNLKAEAFEPFVAAVAATRAMPLLGLDHYAGTIIGAWLDSQIVRSEDGVTVLILLRDAASASVIRTQLEAARAPGVSFIDLKGDVETLVAQYRKRAMNASLAGTAAIFLVLMLQLRRARAVLSMIATIVSTILITSGILLLLRGQLTVFNLVSLLLVVGVASNYTLFFSTLSPEPLQRQRASVSVLLAAASTFIGFSTLAFSSTPVLAMIGLTVSIGAAVGLLASMVFSADSAAEPGRHANAPLTRK